MLSPTTEIVVPAAEPVGEPSFLATDLDEVLQPLTESVAFPTDRLASQVDNPVFEGPDVVLTQGPVEPAWLPDFIPIDESAIESVVLDLSEALPVVGAVGIAAVTTGVIVRGLSSPSTPMVFTNARLIPCYAGATARHVVATSATATSHIGRATTSRVEATVSRIPPIVGGALGGISDGFERVVQDPRRDGEESLSDSKLLVQIGMLLGFAYLAFLTVWFWATRIRWRRDFV